MLPATAHLDQCDLSKPAWRGYAIQNEVMMMMMSGRRLSHEEYLACLIFMPDYSMAAG